MKISLLKFIIKLNVFLLPFYIFISLKPSFGLENLISMLVANVFNMNFKGNKIFITQDEALTISWDCIGLKSVFLFLALVFATEKKNKLHALLFVVLILLYHILRIFFLVYVVIHYSLEYYVFIHTVTWYTSILLIVLFFFIWLKL